MQIHWGCPAAHPVNSFDTTKLAQSQIGLGLRRLIAKKSSKPKDKKQRWVEVESSICGHSDNRLLREIDHSGCLALYSFNTLEQQVV